MFEAYQFQTRGKVEPDRAGGRGLWMPWLQSILWFFAPATAQQPEVQFPQSGSRIAKAMVAGFTSEKAPWRLFVCMSAPCLPRIFAAFVQAPLILPLACGWCSQEGAPLSHQLKSHLPYIITVCNRAWLQVEEGVGVDIWLGSPERKARPPVNASVVP